MRIVEHLRHSMRHPGGVHLTRDGVSLARRVGEGLGTFDLVVTSEIPRAFETAIAMGYGVDEQEAILGSTIFAGSEVDWMAGWAALAESYRRGGQAALAAQCHASVVRNKVASIPEGGRILMVSHGGVLELGVVGLLPDYDYSGWGLLCGYCEGVRMFFEGTACVRAEMLRIADLLA